MSIQSTCVSRMPVFVRVLGLACPMELVGLVIKEFFVKCDPVAEVVAQGIFGVLCSTCMHLRVSYICCVCCDLVWSTVPSCHFVLPSTCYLWT